MEVFLALCSIASLPLGMKVLARYSFPQSPVSALRAITRYSIKLVVFTEFWIVAFGVIARLGWHIPLALTALQILIFNAVFLLLLVRALAAEPKPHYTKESGINIAGYGFVAAGLTQASFLFYFVRQGLSSEYASAHNPYYFRAKAVALLTLLLCQCINLVLVRAAHHDKFFTSHLWQNKRLLYNLGLFLLVLVLIIYLPGVNTFFATSPLGVMDWLWAMSAAALYLGFRLLQRHTRKHTHGAVLKLHRKVYGARHPS